MFRPYTVPADHKDFQVGDQAHICLYTDIEPYTVIERKGKRIKLQKAKAILDPSYKPARIAGGFAGHCTNNHDQKWIITANPDGGIIEGYLGNDNEWYEKGSNRRTVISQGYVKFHDYNF
jgi:hypothetical protein